MSKTERISLVAKSLGGTLYKPVEIPTAEYPQGANDFDGTGQLAGITLKDYHRIFYNTGVTASQAEWFAADRSRTAGAGNPKILSLRAQVMRFHNPFNGLAYASGTVTFTGIPATGATCTLRLGDLIYKFVTGAPSATDSGVNTITVDGAGTQVDMANRLVYAINGTFGGATATGYGAFTQPNQKVWAKNGNENPGGAGGSFVVTITSRIVGPAGNAIVMTAGAGLTNVTLSGATLSGGGSPDIATGGYLYTTPNVISSNVTPFSGYMLENGTWTLVGSSSKLPVTSASSGYALALDGTDVNSGNVFALNYGNGLGVSAVTANDQDVVVNTGGAIRGQTISCRIHSSGQPFPPGGYIDLYWRRRAT